MICFFPQHQNRQHYANLKRFLHQIFSHITKLNPYIILPKFNTLLRLLLLLPTTATTLITMTTLPFRITTIQIYFRISSDYHTLANLQFTHPMLLLNSILISQPTFKTLVPLKKILVIFSPQKFFFNNIIFFEFYRFLIRIWFSCKRFNTQSSNEFHFPSTRSEWRRR